MKISLINMPFAPIEGPSIGLTQIQSVVKQRFDDQVNINTHYLNLDVASSMTALAFYQHAVSPYGRMTGLADWFFRSAAFPDAPDNIDKYLARFYFDDEPETVLIREFIREQRPRVYALLDELIDQYDLASSDIAGFPLLFFQTNASLTMARKLKERNPEIIITLGGAGCEGVMGWELAQQIPYIDYVFSGPALISFPEFVSCQLSGNIDDIINIPGIFQQTDDKSINPDQTIGNDLDINTNIPLDYSSFLDEFEKKITDPNIKPFLMFETSRGCWWADRLGCTFCGLNGLQSQYTSMSPENAITHIQNILKYVPRVQYFVAVDNVAPENYFEDVFPSIKPRENTFIKYETKSNLTSEQIKSLCNAGVHCVQPGVEALSTSTLKLMKKGVTAFDNIRFLKECTRFPFAAEWNILMFSPNEKEDVYEKYLHDIPLLAHLPPPVGVFPIEFVRYSYYFEHPDEFNLQLEPNEHYAYAFPFSKDALRNIAFQFINTNSDEMDSWLGKVSDMVFKWQQRWSNSRPCLILSRAGDSASIYDSRSDETDNYYIEDRTETVLKNLSTPQRMKDLAVKSGLSESDIAQEIELLTEKGLLFEENGRFLSLAVEE